MAGVIFIFQMPMPAPEQDRIFPFGHEESHLMGHGHPIWLIKVNPQTCTRILFWIKHNSVRLSEIKIQSIAIFQNYC